MLLTRLSARPARAVDGLAQRIQFRASQTLLDFRLWKLANLKGGIFIFLCI